MPKPPRTSDQKQLSYNRLQKYALLRGGGAPPAAPAPRAQAVPPPPPVQRVVARTPAVAQTLPTQRVARPPALLPAQRVARPPAVSQPLPTQRVARMPAAMPTMSAPPPMAPLVTAPTVPGIPATSFGAGGHVGNIAPSFSGGHQPIGCGGQLGRSCL